MWKEELEIHCLWKNDRMICCSVNEALGDKKWKMLGCYGIPYRRENEYFWNIMENVVAN